MSQFTKTTTEYNDKAGVEDGLEREKRWPFLARVKRMNFAKMVSLIF